MSTTTHPLAGLTLPETLTVDFQPYGLEILGALELTTVQDKFGEGRTYYGVTGTVLKGSETSRLFQHRHTRDTAGERRTIWAVTPLELERGNITRVAM